MAQQTDIPKVGEAIRRLRVSMHYSLTTLAEESGVSVGMLSQIERDLANPSLRVLAQILAVLKTPLSQLFQDPPEETPTALTFVRRRSQRPQLDFGYLRKELLSTGEHAGLQLMLLHIPAGGSSGPQPLLGTGEKGGLVMQGALTLTVGDESSTLAEGDSFTFEAERPHSFRNTSETEEAIVLWAIARFSYVQHL